MMTTKLDVDRQRLEEKLADQRAQLQRLIVKGHPTQAIEDKLRDLFHALQALREASARLKREPVMPPSDPARSDCSSGGR
ncbi:MAG: hypothetical protein F9K29_05735 [Hyphomicrobiaceae bacterium]|nr:MAG: hypothetical protein F9K29_05735 [Hyphomicrobiaceae bacterium]